MDAIKNILTTGKSKRSSAKPTIIDIGTPTDVKREHHVEHTEDGLVGLPEEFQRLLSHMLTKEELECTFHEFTRVGHNSRGLGP